MTKNNVEIIGFVGQDPKLTSENAPTRLSVATTERWRDDSGEKHERTEWHTVLCWKGLGKVARQFVRKGSHILVSGPLHSREYEKDGVTHTVWEITARELLLLDPRSTANDEADSPAPAPSA